MRSRFDNIQHIKDKIEIVHMELHDPFGVESVIRSVKPDVVFHLAAQSFVGWSWTNPEETLKTNIFGTLYVLEAVRKHCPETRVHIASSSQVYGKVHENEMPMGRKTLFNPMNPYDTSKLGQDMLALQYFNSYGLNIVRTRAFNISGPRRGECFAESSWAKQIALIERGSSRPIIYHGNLESERDYIDVRDVVKWYSRYGFSGEPGEVYILGSGSPVKMRTVLNTLLSFTKVQIVLSEDVLRMRPSDTPTMTADTSDMNGYRGILLEQTLKDLLDYWRERV